MTNGDGSRGEDSPEAAGGEPGANGSAANADALPRASIEEYHTIWLRWTDLHTDDLDLLVEGDFTTGIHLHRYCRVWPFERLKTLPPYNRENRPEMEFLSGLSRTALRYTPLLGLLIVPAFVLWVGVRPVLPEVISLAFTIEALVVATGAVLVLASVGWIVLRADLLEMDELLRALAVYPVLGLLFLGTVASIFLVHGSAVGLGPEQPERVVIVFGYLLLLYLGGLLVYDGMLRTEFLFDRLGDRNRLAVEHVDGGESAKDPGTVYREAFLDDLAERLSESLLGGVPVSHALAVVAILPYVAVWIVGAGPQGTGSWIVFVTNVVFTSMIIIVAFRFLVLIKMLHTLLTDAYVDGETRLRVTYDPFHSDGKGGFRDFGLFATRVNVLLSLAALYLVYRIAVPGVLEIPGAWMGIDGLAWGLNFIVPVIIYGLTMILWLYHTFWTMHRKMVKEKIRHFQAAQIWRNGRFGAVGPTGPSMAGLSNGPDWGFLHQAPEWPIENRQLLLGQVAVNTVPILLGLATLILEV